MQIRNMLTADIEAINRINDAAFAENGGSASFNKLRAGLVSGERDDLTGLVAERDGALLGHIIFSPVTIETDAGTVVGSGLGELAVHPDYQRTGVGRELTFEGFTRLKRTACPFVIVIGVPEYYPRLGFRPGKEFGLACQWDGVPDAAFMAVLLDEQAMAGVTGKAVYTDSFF